MTDRCYLHGMFKETWELLKTLLYVDEMAAKATEEPDLELMKAPAGNPFER